MFTKVCTDCEIERHLSRFSPQKENSDGFKSNCKECQSKRSAQYVNKNRAIVLKKKTALRKKTKDWLIKTKLSAGCAHCGYCERHEALCFHHVVGPKLVKKGFHSGVSLSKMKAELHKCIILCQNCHSIIHADECRDNNSLTISRI